jgi:hypothetical protein
MLRESHTGRLVKRVVNELSPDQLSQWKLKKEPDGYVDENGDLIRSLIAQIYTFERKNVFIRY